MKQAATLLIRKARVLDPATQRDEVLDVLIEQGRLTRLGASLEAPGVDIINAEGYWLLPGLVDTCLHLSEPGHRYSGTIASETRAAAKGGITHLCAQPDTDPVVDSDAVTRLIIDRAEKAGFARVLPLGALTRQLEGQQLAEMHSAREAGCIGVSNGKVPVENTLVLKRCLEYAATFNIPVFFQPQDAALSAKGCAHDGPIAARLGLPSIPVVAESVSLVRMLELVAVTGVRAHFQQISSARGVALIREAKARGLSVSADVSIHHLLLDENAIAEFDSTCKLLPPLRAASDRSALIAGVADGTLDAICSQHMPLSSAHKQVPFPSARPGISGVETLLPLVLRLVAEQQLPLMRALDAITAAAARCLGQPVGALEPARPASLTLVAPSSRWSPQLEWLSAGQNSPWRQQDLTGKPVLTLCEGVVTWQAI